MTTERRSSKQQLELRFKDPRGGRRRGAGRKNRSGQRAHLRRPDLQDRHPVHVTWRLNPGRPSLRREEIFGALRRAVKTARKQGLRVAHFAILSNHLHLILETSDRGSLTRALRSLGISLAKRLNALTGENGGIFQDRYHLEVLCTPTQVRNALHYVLTNEPLHELRNRRFADLAQSTNHGQAKRHRKRARARPPERLPLKARSSRSMSPKDALKRLTFNLFSSAATFDDWKALYGAEFRSITTAPAREIGDWMDEALVPPKTWLLKSGWKRAGTLDC